MRYPQHCQLTTNISSNITNATHFSRPPTLIHQPPYPQCTPTTSHLLPCQPRQHVNHVTQVSTPPTLAHHPRKHATRASTYSTPFLKLTKCMYLFGLNHRISKKGNTFIQTDVLDSDQLHHNDYKINQMITSFKRKKVSDR